MIPASTRFPDALVTDFDGTMTRQDFYRLVQQHLPGKHELDHWQLYRDGLITHFEALRRIFADIRASEAELLALVEKMELDPDVAGGIDRLRRHGWQVIVASAGCDWYIRRLLAGLADPPIVHANPGHFEPGRGLFMSLPEHSPFFTPRTGIDKAAVVRAAIGSHRRVAFAGDGFPDVDAALLVSAPLRFARGDLADELRNRGAGFRPFERWSQIVTIILDERPPQ